MGRQGAAVRRRRATVLGSAVPGSGGERWPPRKKTATYPVARFYDPEAGAVRLDGVDVRELTLESLSGHMGIVLQDTFLFHASVRDNLLYARPEASDQELEAAARAAHIHQLIESLPDGYDTVVGERGHRLSGGKSSGWPSPGSSSRTRAS